MRNVAEQDMWMMGTETVSSVAHASVSEDFPPKKRAELAVEKDTRRSKEEN